MSPDTTAPAHQVISQPPALASIERTLGSFVVLRRGEDGLPLTPEDACPWTDLAGQARQPGLSAAFARIACCEAEAWVSSMASPSGLRRDAFRVAWRELDTERPEEVVCFQKSDQMLRILFREVLRVDGPRGPAEAAYASLRPRAIASGVLPGDSPPWPERAALLDRLKGFGIPMSDLARIELSTDLRIAMLAELAVLADGIQRLACGVLRRALGKRPNHTHRTIAGRKVLVSAWDTATPVWLQVRELNGVSQVTDLRLPVVPADSEDDGAVFVAQQQRWLRDFYGAAIGPTHHTSSNARSPHEGGQTP